MILSRPVLFAIVAVALSTVFSMLIISSLLSFSFGAAIAFGLLFLIAPFIAAWLIGYRNPIQLVIIFFALMVLGSIAAPFAIAGGWISFILTFVVYIIAAWIVELIKP